MTSSRRIWRVLPTYAVQIATAGLPSNTVTFPVLGIPTAPTSLAVA